MKAKIKKTSEIIEVSVYVGTVNRIGKEPCKEFVYVENKGDIKDYSKLYHGDELIILDAESMNMQSTIDWEQRRYELAKDAMKGIISAFTTNNEKIDNVIFPGARDVSVTAIQYADDMIYCLKGSYYDKANNT